MRAAEQFALAWLALRRTVGQWFRPMLWAPWLLLGLVQAVVLAALWGFAHPWVSWFAAPLLTRIGGEDVLHFPRVLTILPRLYGRADIAIGALVGAVAIGAATHLFAQRFRGETLSVGAAAAWVARRVPLLVAAQLPLNASLLLLGVGLEWLALQPGGPMRQVAIQAAGWTLPVLIQACFLFVVPLVVIEGRGLVAAFRELPGVWRSGYWAAVFLGAVLLLPLVPFQLLAASSAAIVSRGDPDLVGWLTLAQLGAGLCVGFALSGSSALYYLSGLAERDE